MIKPGFSKCDDFFSFLPCLNPSPSLTETAMCALDCGDHGECQGTSCACDKGWEGPRCQSKQCHPLCTKHGQCKVSFECFDA